MGAAAKAAKAKAASAARGGDGGGQGTGFYMGRNEGFDPAHEDANISWMNKYFLHGGGGFQPKVLGDGYTQGASGLRASDGTYWRPTGEGVFTHYAVDGRALERNVQNMDLWTKMKAGTTGAPAATPPPAPGSTPSNGDTNGDGITLSGTNEQDQFYDPTPGATPPVTVSPNAPQPAPTPNAAPPALSTTPPVTPSAASQSLFGSNYQSKGSDVYTNSQGVDVPRAAPTGVTGMGGTNQGAMAVSQPQASKPPTVGTNAAPTGRPNSGAIAGPAMSAPQQSQQPQGAPVQVAQQPPADLMQPPVFDYHKALASYGPVLFPGDPSAPQPKIQAGRNWFNPLNGMWGKAI